MKLLKNGAFVLPISSLGIAIFLSFALIFSSAMVMFLSIAKPDLEFNPVTDKRIVPLSAGIMVIGLASFILFYVLAIKNRRVKNE